MTMQPQAWPALPHEEWVATKDTLHMYTQVIGKLRLALSPFEPEWAHVTLYVTPRGLTTSSMPHGSLTIDAEFDLIDHALVMRSSDGRFERRPLGGPVADFYRDVMNALGRMGVDVAISEMPSEVPNPIPFPDDRTHDTYVPDHAARFHRVLSTVDVVLKEHRGGFLGRSTPVHFFWGTFDLALTRYSGRLLDPQPDAGPIQRVGGDAEQICTGWWPGDERYPQPAFFAYEYPAPPGVSGLAIEPVGAAWNEAIGEFIMPYDVARSAADPRQAVLDFAGSTYRALAELGRWGDDLTRVTRPETSQPRVAPAGSEHR